MAIAAPSPLLTSAIVTGAITAPRRIDAPTVHQGDADASLVREAERAQARVDLVKLELARRTYDETRLGGQPSSTRPDWRVLERARDAWTDAELSASKAAGFEANAYINDDDRKIVVAIAGTQDLRRDFLEADIWRALIQAQAPQQFFLAKSYIRSVSSAYQAHGYDTECVGHSLGGGACAYAALRTRHPRHRRQSDFGGPVAGAGPLLDHQLRCRRRYRQPRLQRCAGQRTVRRRAENQRRGRSGAPSGVARSYGPLAGPILIVRDIRRAP